MDWRFSCPASYTFPELNWEIKTVQFDHSLQV